MSKCQTNCQIVTISIYIYYIRAHQLCTDFQKYLSTALAPHSWSLALHSASPSICWSYERGNPTKVGAAVETLLRLRIFIPPKKKKKKKKKRIQSSALWTWFNKNGWFFKIFQKAFDPPFGNISIIKNLEIVKMHKKIGLVQPNKGYGAS